MEYSGGKNPPVKKTRRLLPIKPFEFYSSKAGRRQAKQISKRKYRPEVELGNSISLDHEILEENRFGNSFFRRVQSDCIEQDYREKKAPTRLSKSVQNKEGRQNGEFALGK